MLATTGIRTTSLTVPWPQPNLLNFLRRSHGQPRFYWESGREPIAIAGFGAAAMFSAGGPERFSSIRKQVGRFWDGFQALGENPAPPGLPQPCIFGGFSFRTAPETGQHDQPGVWKAFGEARFFVPQYQILRYQEQTWLTVTARMDGVGDFSVQDALWDIPGMFEVLPAGGHAGAPAPDLMMDPAGWAHIVTEARGRIDSGELKKVVAARGLALNAPVDPLQALGRLSGKYPDCYRFLFEPEAGHAFFGASPELLASVSGQRLETMALAGSAPRGETMDEDLAFGQALLSSKKDLREHRYVIQDVRNCLAGLLPEVEVGETGLLQLSNIQHLHTPLTAGPLNGFDILDFVEALHPTPAVGGLPRRSAQDFIDENETLTRGWYASPVGWVDSIGGGVFTVGLRSAVTGGGTTRLYAGAGIVRDSVAELEWAETELKFAPILEAVR